MKITKGVNWDGTLKCLPLFIRCIHHHYESQDTHICTSNSGCLHTRGLFLCLCSPSLALLSLNLSRCVYRRWITLHFHSGRSWKKIDWFVVRFYGRLCHLHECLCLEVMYGSVWDLLIARGCRLVPVAFPGLVGRWGSGPQGVFSFVFFLPCRLAEGAAENAVWQAAKPAVTQQGIDWIISVSSDSNVAYTDPLLQATWLSSLPGINACEKKSLICL